MENEWAKALKGNPPKSVEVEITLVYDEGAKRAKKFVIDYVVDGVPDTVIFKNKLGG